jgi:hypothetical protein
MWEQTCAVRAVGSRAARRHPCVRTAAGRMRPERRNSPGNHAVSHRSPDPGGAARSSSGMQSPPAVVNSAVLVATDDGIIQALRASGGKVSWSGPISGRMYAGPVTDAPV